MFALDTFWLPSVLMGVGIAIDVTIATIVMFRDEKLSLRTWTLPIATTHILFPGIGYYLVWGLGATFAFLQVALGLFGAILVAAFLYESGTEWCGRKPKFAISDWMSERFAGKGLSWLTPTILAVSWDALWSGPAKAAQAVAWSTSEVMASFVVAGIVVAVAAQMALGLAFMLRHINFTSVLHLALFNLSGKFLIMVVIGGFGILSLWHGISPTEPHGGLVPNLYTAIIVAAAWSILFFAVKLGELWNTEIVSSRDAVGEYPGETEDEP